jgi:DNA invertase Pin-like site-specific DNA recombinase
MIAAARRYVVVMVVRLRGYAASAGQPSRRTARWLAQPKRALGARRLGRDMRHLINLLDELRALDVGLVTLGEGLDTTTPAGRMAFGIFASVAEFERERLRERTLLGLDRARAEGKQLGRPVDAKLRARIAECAGLSVREAAKRVGCSTATIQKVRKLAA